MRTALSLIGFASLAIGIHTCYFTLGRVFGFASISDAMLFNSVLLFTSALTVFLLVAGLSLIKK